MSSTSAKLSVWVHPYATRNQVISFTDGVLQVRIAAPLQRGKVNVELVTFLSQLLGVSRNQLTIVQGLTSRKKVIAIDGLSQKYIIERLKPYASSSVNTRNTQ